MFVQVLDPLGGLGLSAVVALLPVGVLLLALAGLRLPAWVTVIITSAATIWLAVLVWRAPLGGTLAAYGLGAATGVWSVDWIILWGVVIYHTLRATGGLDALREWLLARAGPDVRVQTLLLAWSFGALLEGLVGFGYPWAVVTPILIALGIERFDAVRVAALSNNAPVSFGALGAPVIALATVTGLPPGQLSASIGQLTALLALAPPFLLIYLVSGWSGLREGWPLGLAASVGFVIGQLPTSEFLGPYLPAVVGAATSFLAIGLLRRWWNPRLIHGTTVRGPVAEPPGDDSVTTVIDTRAIRAQEGATRHPEAGRDETTRAADLFVPTGPGRGTGTRAGAGSGGDRRSTSAPARGLVPLGILVAVVVAWTGPWSPLPGLTVGSARVTATGSLGGPVAATFSFAPFVAGTAIMAAWVGICGYLRPSRSTVIGAFVETGRQMRAALVVAPLVFGLATVFNYAGLASTLARGVAALGVLVVCLAPVLGWIAVALSGSNTSANTIFGAFQLSVGRLVGAPPVLLPALNSVGAEIGKPVAPQTASVGVSTIGLSGSEGRIIRNNMPWTLGLLAYLAAFGGVFYLIS